MQDSTASNVRFDLSNGSVHAGEGERLVLVPCSALDELGRTAGVEVTSRFARAMGKVMGMRVADRLGSSDAVRSASLESFVNALGAELAVAGWGAISLERWGRAMVLVIEHSPLAEHAFVAAILEGALGAATGRDIHCAALGTFADQSAHILVANERAVGRARGWLADGVAWGDVLQRLQAGGSPS